MASALFCLLLCLGIQPPARAHGVFLYAWRDGPRICTESYFSRSNKVRRGTVTMAAGDGAILASGLSDAAGLLCFAAPERPQTLIFTVEAGPGHKGRFTLPPASRDAEPVSDAPRPTEQDGTAVPPKTHDILTGIGIIMGAAALFRGIRVRSRTISQRK